MLQDYVATGIIEKAVYTSKSGRTLPDNYLIAITMADPSEGIDLGATDRVISIIDTGTALDRDVPDWDQCLAARGWSRPEGSDWRNHYVCWQAEVIADQPDQVPPPVTYHDGEPLPLYLVAQSAQVKGLNTKEIIDVAVHAATERAILAGPDLTRQELRDKLSKAAHDAAAVTAKQFSTTVDQASARPAAWIVSAAVDAIYEERHATIAASRSALR